MSLGQESTDFEWLDAEQHPPQCPHLSEKDRASTTDSDFLKEGYLHIMEQIPSQSEDDAQTALSRMAMKLVRRTSDPSIVGSWNKRWCVLSRTAQGIHLLLYKDQSSYSNLHSPCGILALESCLKLSSLPTHKSDNAFTITLNKREFLFYTDKSSDFEEWLQVLKDGLNLEDAYFHSPLKGLPRQKALRKDGTPSSEAVPPVPPQSAVARSPAAVTVLKSHSNSHGNHTHSVSSRSNSHGDSVSSRSNSHGDHTHSVSSRNSHGDHTHSVSSRSNSHGDHTHSAAVLEGVLATSEAPSSDLWSEGVAEHTTVRRSISRKHPQHSTELEPVRVTKFKKLNT